jgi:ATP-binding cassette subfamily F protein 3
LVFVSHDRYFVDALATRVIEVNDGRTTSWLGNYEDFLRAKGLQGETEHSELRVEQLGSSTLAQVAGDDREARLKAHATRKETQRSEQKKLKEVAEVEAMIAELEGEVAALEAQMADPELYHDAARWKEISARHALLKDEVNNLFERWEGLQTDV